jgi:hypothetical protein
MTTIFKMWLTSVHQWTLDNAGILWDIPIMAITTKKRKKQHHRGPTLQATMVDERRRITLPREIPPHSAVTIQRLDAYTWVVKRQRPEPNLAVVLIPVIDKLPDDPEWEALERKMADHTFKNLPRFQE